VRQHRDFQFAAKIIQADAPYDFNRLELHSFAKYLKIICFYLRLSAVSLSIKDLCNKSNGWAEFVGCVSIEILNLQLK